MSKIISVLWLTVSIVAIIDFFYKLITDGICDTATLALSAAACALFETNNAKSF